MLVERLPFPVSIGFAAEVFKSEAFIRANEHVDAHRDLSSLSRESSTFRLIGSELVQGAACRGRLAVW